jgi:hypothetical protein
MEGKGGLGWSGTGMESSRDFSFLSHYLALSIPKSACRCSRQNLHSSFYNKTSR